MKYLIEISKIVTKKKVRKIEIFDDHSLKHKNSKFNEFYESLMEGKFRNDRDAATQLYNCSPTDDKYRQLKSRFKKRLLNTLFFLDVNLPATSTYDRAYYSCNKDWTLVKILLSNNAEHTAASLARQLLTTALKFKFADVIVNCSRILRRYAAMQSDDKKYETYDEHIKEYQEVLAAEMRSEEYYQRTLLSYQKSSTNIEKSENQIMTFCDELVELSETYDSPIINYNMYLVWVYRFEMSSDYISALQVCSNAETYIEENPRYYQDDKLAIFQLKKMAAYLHLCNHSSNSEKKNYYNEGKLNAEKCLKSFPEGSYIWFNFMEYYLLMSIHTDNFINALAIYKRASSNSKFKKLIGVEKEKWYMFDNYLNYIVESQRANNPILAAQQRSNFRVSRILNQTASYPKNQRILNVYLMIIQVLFFIEKNNYAEATERINELRNYANHQLKKDIYFRAIQFIRLLQQVVRADFSLNSLNNTEKYYNRLISRSFMYRGLLEEIEIIPYDKLWLLLLDRLKK
jgi:hypothetical protein